jgi:hypothetical protein
VLAIRSVILVPLEQFLRISEHDWLKKSTSVVAVCDLAHKPDDDPPTRAHGHGVLHFAFVNILDIRTCSKTAPFWTTAVGVHPPNERLQNVTSGIMFPNLS